MLAWKRNPNPEMLKLPAYCIPAQEAPELLSKREQKLAWMRDQGVQYILGRPIARYKTAEKRVA